MLICGIEAAEAAGKGIRRGFAGRVSGEGDEEETGQSKEHCCNCGNEVVGRLLAVHLGDEEEFTCLRWRQAASTIWLKWSIADWTKM